MWLQQASVLTGQGCDVPGWCHHPAGWGHHPAAGQMLMAKSWQGSYKDWSYPIFYIISWRKFEIFSHWLLRGLKPSTGIHFSSILQAKTPKSNGNPVSYSSICKVLLAAHVLLRPKGNLTDLKFHPVLAFHGSAEVEFMAKRTPNSRKISWQSAHRRYSNTVKTKSALAERLTPRNTFLPR